MFVIIIIIIIIVIIIFIFILAIYMTHEQQNLGRANTAVGTNNNTKTDRRMQCPVHCDAYTSNTCSVLCNIHPKIAFDM